VFKKATVRPSWHDLEERLETSVETRHENSRERVGFGGPVLELLRRVHVEHLRNRMEAFYEHGNTADVLVLSLYWCCPQHANT
jgi:hypothetical protein